MKNHPFPTFSSEIIKKYFAMVIFGFISFGFNDHQHILSKKIIFKDGLKNVNTKIKACLALILIIVFPNVISAAQSCPVDPKLVFILDDSSSINNIERAEMTISIQGIVDKVELTYPNAQFAIVQYGTFSNPVTPEEGSYNIVMNYTTNPVISITDNVSFIEDHLPDSIDKMITDNIFTTGVLSNPDAFFIFTDAARNFNGGVCCSNLENAVNNVSSDAELGFGEYSKLASLSTTGNVSLYQVVNQPVDSSPEIVQGAGVHQTGNFSLVQANIDAISDSLCSTPELPEPASCTSNTGYFQNSNLSENYSCVAGEGNFGKVVSDWDLVLGTAEAFIHDAPACQYRPNVEHIGGAAPAMTNLSAYSGVVYGGLHNYGSGFGGDYTYPREVVIQNLATNLPAGLATELSLVSAITNYAGTNKFIDKFGNPGTWQVYGIRAGASYTPPSGAAACSLETDANVDLLGTTGLVNSLNWQVAKVKFTTLAEYDRVILSPTCGVDSYLLFDCVTLKAVPVVSGQCTSQLNFENPVLEAGVKKLTGAIYRFSDVKTNAAGSNVDALVEILNMSNAVLLDIDSTISGDDASLQIELDLDNSPSNANSNAVPDKHVDFDIRFVESGTNNPITIDSIQTTAVDLDGNSANWAGGLTVRTREYTILPDADTYTYEKVTNLTSTSPGRFIPQDYKNWNGIDTTNTLAMVTAKYSNVSSIKYTTGIQSEGTSYSAYHRQFSLNFGCLAYDDPVIPPPVSACFDPILIDDDANHRFWKITGANNISDLTGEDLNDGSGPDIIQVGSYDKGYNMQDIAYDNNGQIWGLASGTGANGHTLGHAFIGQVVENAGVYSFTNVTNLGATYSGHNTGKALVWDPYNSYFIYDANKFTWTNPATLKAFDPVTNTVVADPWGTGSSELSITIPTAAAHYSIQGLAFAPDGTLYGIAGAGTSTLFTFEKDASKRLTGNVTKVGLDGLGIGFRNLEVLEFTGDGQLVVMESNTGLSALQSKVYTVDTSTGVPTEVADLDAGYSGSNRDWEGIKFCNTPFGPKSASISGNVFQDANTNDIFESSESGLLNISVWRQTVKSDGTLDPTKTTAITDAQGNYSFTNIDDGDYHIFVDTSDTDIPLGWLFGGTNPLVININNKNSVSNANFPFDETVCTAFSGEVSEAALLAPNQVEGSNKIIVPSTALSPRAGHLRAYNLKADGQADESKVVWDAASKMTTLNRSNKLYTTDSSGKKIKINDVSTLSDNIKSYTLTPSFNKGSYLAGRKEGAFLGAISRGNGLSLLTTEIDTFKYLHDPVYQTYYKDTVLIKRKESVLVASDDGFLYSFNYSNGKLLWGWMPDALLAELSDFSTFQEKKFMTGDIRTLDLKKSGQYKTYIIGSYKSGLGHYVLKLNDTGKLQSVIWDIDSSGASGNTSPNNGQMDFFTDVKGVTYMTYVITHPSNSSTLVIRSITDDNTVLEIPLGFKATSTPFVMHDFKKHNAPQNKTLYIGADDGKLYKAYLLDTDGKLKTKAALKTDFEKAHFASLASSVSDPILFIGASISQSDKRYYLRAQSKSQLSVFKYNSSDSDWNKVWTSYLGGSKKIDTDGNETNDPSSIQPLPSNATITDEAYIVSDSIVLPVNVTDSSAAVCYGKAYYYLYKLTDGSIPNSTFMKSDSSYITHNIYLGYGKPTRLTLSDIPQKDTLVGYGHSDQKDDNTTGVNQTVLIKDSFPTGVRSWRVIDGLD